MELDSRKPLENIIYLDEAGFNQTKGRKRGWNLIGHRATADVSGQWGGNIMMCAPIADHSVLTHIPLIGPYNTQHFLTFLDTLYRDLIPDDKRGLIQNDLPKYVVIWDSVSFHYSNTIRQWLANHNSMLMEFLPSYFPLFSPDYLKLEKTNFNLYLFTEKFHYWSLRDLV